MTERQNEWDGEHYLAIGQNCWGRSTKSIEAAKRIARDNKPYFVKRSRYVCYRIPAGCDYAICGIDGGLSWPKNGPQPERL